MKEIAQRNKEIKINMLGRFTLEYDGKVVLEDDGKIHKVWSLLGYLIANHKRTLGAQELQELLCGDDRSSNPAGAVKNLAYRLRNLLATSGLPAENYIAQNGGVYRWNDELNYTLDIDEFETFYMEAKKMDDDEAKRAELYLKAINLYYGRFLPNFAYDEWAMSPTTYYHRLFVESLTGVCGIFEKNSQYEQMVSVCEKAIPIDPYEEELYIIYIRGLVKLGRQKEALDAYQTITRRLYDQLGVNPSKELHQVYKDIISTLKNVEMDLLAIKEDLKEQGNLETCFFCEYLVFKGIYRQIARQVERTGQSIYIMLCTLTDKHNEIPEVHYLSEAMGELKTVIGTQLRRGDLFARYSHSQFVIMLMDATYENSQSVSKRIQIAYDKNKISKLVLMDCKIQPLDPKEY